VLLTGAVNVGDRNGSRFIVPTAPATTTTLMPGSTNLTEVVVQLYLGTEAFSTVINGGHNWPGPTTVGNPPVASHFDATPKPSSTSGTHTQPCRNVEQSHRLAATERDPAHLHYP
jgi:hypothetical protein